MMNIAPAKRLALGLVLSSALIGAATGVLARTSVIVGGAPMLRS